MVDVTSASLAHRLSGQLHRRRDRSMSGYPRQPAQLIGAEAEHVVEAGVGAIELQGAVELALAPQHAGRKLVGEAAVALGQAGEVVVARLGERRTGSYGAENLESRPTSGGCFLNPASP